MDSYGRMRTSGVITDSQMITMTEWSALAQISAYMVESIIKLVVGATIVETHEKDEIGYDLVPDSQMLDRIYDDEALRFEKDTVVLTKRIQAQDPLEELNLRNGTIKTNFYKF